MTTPLPTYTFLGHGRTLELYLIIIKFVYALILFPGWPSNIVILSDWQWTVPGFLVAAPFALVASVQALGLWLNYRGYEISWVFRAAGAMAAIMLWSYILFKSLAISEVVTGIFPLAVTSLPFSARILWKALNRLPIPGAPGQV